MTLHFKTADLRAAIAQLQPVLSGKSSLPVLGAVQFLSAGNETALNCSNMDVWMRQMVPTADSTTDFYDFLLPGRLLHEALARITADELKLTVEGSAAVLRAGSAKLSLPLITEPFPALPDAEWSKPILIDDLQAKLRLCLPFVGKLPVRPLNMAVHFGKGRLEACDGRRFIGVDTPESKGSHIIPTELCQLVTKTEGAVTIRFAGSMAEFSGEGWTITGKLLESATGAWIATDSMYKQKTVMTVKSSARELIEAVSLAAFSLPTLIDSVAIEPHADKLVFRFKGDDKGHMPCEAEVAAEVDNPQQVAGVSARSLESALRAICHEGADEVELRFEEFGSFSVQRGGIFVSCMLTRLG
jgi:DNA polymerase III sliding clamp (beta) subunit (PCNA family)